MGLGRKGNTTIKNPIFTVLNLGYLLDIQIKQAVDVKGQELNEESRVRGINLRFLSIYVIFKGHRTGWDWLIDSFIHSFIQICFEPLFCAKQCSRHCTNKKYTKENLYPQNFHSNGEEK